MVDAVRVRRGLLWETLALALLALLPGLVLRTPLWGLDPVQLAQVAGLCLARLVGAGVLWVGWRFGMERTAWRVAAGLGLPLAAYYLALLVLDAPYSRLLLLAGTTVYLALGGIALFRNPWRLAVVGPAVALLTIALVPGVRSPAPPQPVAGPEISTLYTGYHAVRMERYPVLPIQDIQGGGLAPVGQDLLLLTGSGAFYLVRFDAGGISVDPLGVHAPLNRAELLQDMPPGWTADMFRATHVLTRALPWDSVLVIAAHHYWRRSERCFVLRLSSTRLAVSELRPGGSDPGWNVLLDTSPCLPVAPETHVFPGHQPGGRMAWFTPDTLLVTVGDHELDGVTAPETVSQDPASHYGKTLLVGLQPGRAVEFSRGHRNAGGLHVAADGTIWLTEHGPAGGDEPNRLVRGGNYGWPFQTHGTDYHDVVWPLLADTATPGFLAPDHAWVPSIGVSSVMAVDGTRFARWAGDLLVASLRAETLYRLRFEAGRVAYVEPIPVGGRVRDLAGDELGRLVLWTDEGALLVLDPLDDRDGEALFRPCAGCHFLDGARHAMGPDLRGVYGRRVASVRGFQYSRALRALRGTWTAELLDAYLANPRAVTPGTPKPFRGLARSDHRRDLIAYLKALAEE